MSLECYGCFLTMLPSVSFMFPMAKKKSSKSIEAKKTESRQFDPPAGIPGWAKAGLPSPEDLALEAALEPEDDEVSPADYIDAIYQLRERGLSWRRIAEWFSARGLKFNHVAVFRAYQDAEEQRAAVKATETGEEGAP